MTTYYQDSRVQVILSFKMSSSSDDCQEGDEELGLDENGREKFDKIEENSMYTPFQFQIVMF